MTDADEYASKKRPTISDVARLAEVSTATVSRALQDPKKVSELTRQKVFDAVSKTGYRINRVAQMLRQNRSGTVLVVVPEIEDASFAEILSGIEATATEANYNIIIGNTAGRAQRAKDLLTYLTNGRADGALLLNCDIPDAKFEPGDLPIVSVAKEIPETNFPHVGIDNTRAASDITQFLIDLGHKRISHIAGNPGNILSQQRRLGYENAMDTAGLKNLIQVFEGGVTTDASKTASEAILSLQERPSAVVCASDELAMGLISVLQENGLKVPEDISVTGFGNIAFTSMFSPALSTIHQSGKEIGQRAMTLLMEVMAGSKNHPPYVRVEHDLVARQSSQPLNAQGSKPV